MKPIEELSYEYGFDCKESEYKQRESSNRKGVMIEIWTFTLDKEYYLCSDGMNYVFYTPEGGKNLYCGCSFTDMLKEVKKLFKRWKS